MSHDSNDIYSIVERLRMLEEGLDKDQRSVNQLSGTFRPRTVAVLTAKTDPANPLAGKLVGSAEDAEPDKTMLQAGMAEDVLDKMKNSFRDFVRQAEKSIDKDVQKKTKEDTDLKAKKPRDRSFRDKDLPAGSATDDQQDLPSDLAYQRGENPYDADQPQTESHAVKMLEMVTGQMLEIHRTPEQDYEIQHRGRSLPTRFSDIEQAEMAVEMYNARLHNQAHEPQPTQSQEPDCDPDYIEEK